MYEVTYEEGSQVYTQNVSYLIQEGKAEFIQMPQYCHPCGRRETHVFYAVDDRVRCLTCSNDLGENDTRPDGKVLNFIKKKLLKLEE